MPDKSGFIGFAEKAKDLFTRTILPALKVMAPSFFLGCAVFLILLFSGLGDMLGNNLAAMAGPIPAALIVCAVCFIPALSPLLGPGLVIAIAAGVLTGEQIAAGKVIPFIALPALFAIDVQIGGSFIPPGLVMGINEPETINAGVPGIVFTRLIILPATVVLACFFSFVL